MKYRLVLFDFDGTLADSFPFFVRVFNRLAVKHGFEAVDPEVLPTLRDHGAREVMRRVGMPAWKLPWVAKDFTALMKEPAGRVPLFDGVGEVLARLDDASVPLAIVTSNTEENVRRILGDENAGRIRRFECGASIFGKAARLRKVLRATGIAASEAIYVGDHATDLQAAREAGVSLGAVTWGYGTVASLRAESPDLEFASVSELADLAGNDPSKPTPSPRTP